MRHLSLVILCLAASVPAFARIGETEEESVKANGKPELTVDNVHKFKTPTHKWTTFTFRKKDSSITQEFCDGKCILEGKHFFDEKKVLTYKEVLEYVKTVAPKALPAPATLKIKETDVIDLVNIPGNRVKLKLNGCNLSVFMNKNRPYISVSDLDGLNVIQEEMKKEGRKPPVKSQPSN